MSEYKFGAEVVEPKPVASEVRAVEAKQIPWLGILNLLGLALLAIAFMRGGSPVPVPPGPGPEPEVAADVESVVAAATKQLIENRSKVSERLAEDVLGGKIQNSNQLYEMAKAYTEKGDEIAFAKVNELNKKYITESGDKGWSESDKKLIAEFQKRKAQGSRKAIK